MRVLLTVAYDGSQYFGWQRQKGYITVQQRLEEALGALLGQEITVRGASRTDTGVHALAQGAVFRADTTIPVENIPYAVNSFLPEDIAVTGAREVDEEFHPQYSVKDKTYEYRILNSEFKNPLLVRYTDFVRERLDIDAMRSACPFFEGEHDFKAFCASGSRARTTVRTIYSLTVDKADDIILIRVKGSGFLYNMVRIIAGTLADVGRGRISPNDIGDIILSRDRTRAGKTMAPNGLILTEVNYGR